MDSTLRTLVKSVTWQSLGIVTGTAIGYLFTGSVTASGGIAVAGACSGTVFYILHEKLWERVDWGRHRARTDRATGLPEQRHGHMGGGHPAIGAAS